MTFEATLEVDGKIVVVFERGGEQVSLVAAVISAADYTMTIRLELPVSWPNGGSLTVHTGSGMFSRHANVISAASKGSEMAIVHSGWQHTLDRRASPRYPVLLEVDLISGALKVPGRIVDLSERGAALEVSQWEQMAFEVELDGTTISCRAVAIEPLPMIDVVHATFIDAVPETLATVAQVVERARLEFTEGQRKLARGIDRHRDRASTQNTA